MSSLYDWSWVADGVVGTCRWNMCAVLFGVLYGDTVLSAQSFLSLTTMWTIIPKMLQIVEMSIIAFKKFLVWGDKEEETPTLPVTEEELVLEDDTPPIWMFTIPNYSKASDGG
jgi:hypothetical protein